MPFGTINVDSVVNSDGITSGGAYGFKNRIINGAMVIDQRNAGAAVTSNNYCTDRWRVETVSDGVFSAQQVSDAPTGFVKSLKWTTTTADASLTTTQYAIIRQGIEGFNTADLMWGTANAQTITVSFWVKSSLTGTFGGTVHNSDANRSYPYTYTISSANTWEQKSVTIAGDTTGTWKTDNNAGIQIYWGLGVGPTYSGTANTWAATLYMAPTGAVSVIGTLNATWQITGVQLEKGSTATSFDYRPYSAELAMCQRYYQQINGNSFVGTAAYGMIGSGMVYTTTQADISIPLKVSMRATPTISQSTTTIQVGGALYASTGIGDAGSTPNVIFARISNAGTMTAGYGANFQSNNNAAGYFAASAEL